MVIFNCVGVAVGIADGEVVVAGVGDAVVVDNGFVEELVVLSLGTVVGDIECEGRLDIADELWLPTRQLVQLHSSAPAM